MFLFFADTKRTEKEVHCVCRPRDCVGMERASTAYLWAGAMWGVPGGGQRRCLPTADLRAEAGVTTQRGTRGPRHEAEFGTLFEKGVCGLNNCMLGIGWVLKKHVPRGN